MYPTKQHQGLGEISIPKVAELSNVAAALSPGMAIVLEKLVAAYFVGMRPQFTFPEIVLLQCAGGALSVVNRTPGSAQEIGRKAAAAVFRNPNSLRLLEAAQTLNQRRIA